MGSYDVSKDVLSVAQKVDNIDLHRQLLDSSAQALGMQEEVIELKAENKELKSQKDIGDDIEHYIDPFITRKPDKKLTKYCAACWADKRKLLPLQDFEGNDYRCPFCKFKIMNTSSWTRQKHQPLSCCYDNRIHSVDA